MESLKQEKGEKQGLKMNAKSKWQKVKCSSKGLKHLRKKTRQLTHTTEIIPFIIS